MNNKNMPSRHFYNYIKALFLFIKGFIVIIAFLIIGKLINHFLNIPIPGSIIGLLLLFTALSLKIIDINIVEPASHTLLKYMTLFFVPAGVGLMNYIDILSNNWLAIIISSLISTMIVIICIGLSYQRAVK